MTQNEIEALIKSTELQHQLPQPRNAQDQPRNAQECMIPETEPNEKPIKLINFIHKNGIGFLSGSVIKYITRYEEQGSIVNLEKASYNLLRLLEIELAAAKYGLPANQYTPIPCKMVVDPIEYAMDNKLSMLAGNVVAYLTKYNFTKNIKDLEEARISLEWLLTYAKANPKGCAETQPTS